MDETESEDIQHDDIKEGSSDAHDQKDSYSDQTVTGGRRNYICVNRVRNRKETSNKTIRWVQSHSAV